MLPNVPAPLAEIFSKQVTVTTAQLRRLLPMNAKMLQAHIRLGHIDYVEFAPYGGKTFRVFTLEQVLRFINSRSYREDPYPLRPSRRGLLPAGPINEESFTFRQAMRREAEEAEKRRAYKAAVAEHGHFSKLLPPSVGLDCSPLAMAARKRLREDVKADREAVVAAKQAERENRPRPGESATTWRRRLAAERADRIAERAALRNSKPPP